VVPIVGDRRATLVLLLILCFVLSILSLPLVSAAEDSWVSKAPMHEARSGVGVAVVNGKIYAIGGAGTSGFYAFNEEYDPATDTWMFKTPMPTPRSDFGIAVYLDKIYCMGGYTIEGAGTDVNEVYDPATDSWETKASLPSARLGLQANIVNGKIYLIGGYEWSNGTRMEISSLTEVYDPVSDTWTSKASIAAPVSYYASAVIDNRIYVITSNLNQIYDAESDSWNTGAPPPVSVVLASAGATESVFAPERIYVFGADADMPYYQLTVRQFTTQSYDPKNNNWSVCDSIPTGRFDADVAVLNESLYVIGGYTLEGGGRNSFFPSTIFSAVNEQYTPIGNIPEFHSLIVLPMAMIVILIVALLRRRGVRATNSCPASKRVIATLTMKKLKKISLVSLLITIILILSSATVHAFEVTAAITLENPGGYYGIAYDSGKSEIFLTNADFDLVSVISDNANAVVANIPVGSQPVGIAYDSAKGELFVANYASDSISVINDSTNTVVANIPVGSQPFAVVYDSGKGEIFVTNYNSSSVSVISDITNKVVANIPVGSQPCDLAYDSGKGEIFVGHAGCNQILVISDSTNAIVANVNVGANPIGLAYNSGNGQIFVANYNSNSVSVISDSTNTVIANVTLENQPQGICYDSGKGEIFVTYSESNRVSVISDSSLPLPNPSIPDYPLPLTVTALMVVCVGLLVYFKKRRE